MKNLSVVQLPVLKDNYIFIIRVEGSDACAVVDPAEAEPVLAYLKRHNLRLEMILNTHHHGDHTGGNLELQAAFGCPVYASAYDKSRIPGQTQELKDGDRINFAGHSIEVIATPGHTLGHIVYHIPDAGLLFVGDTLFSMGCGRLFEGTAAAMWKSLTRLRELPQTTQVYCAHEYTLHNASFVKSLDWPAAGLDAYISSRKKLRAAEEATIPTDLGSEKKWNPFLCADDPSLAAALHLKNADPIEVFQTIRSRRNEF